MSIFNWKNKYYNSAGVEVIHANYNLTYFSPLSKGTGTRDNPKNTFLFSQPAIANQAVIFSGGYILSNATLSEDMDILGSGNMQDTVIDLNLTTSSWPYVVSAYKFKDITFRSISTKEVRKNGNAGLHFYKCDIASIYAHNNQLSTNRTQLVTASQCVLRSNLVFQNSDRISYIKVVDSDINKTNLTLHEECKVIITQESVNKYKDLYQAFSDCEFKIGTETEYSPLEGNTESELRNSFVSRYEAVYGEGTLPVNKGIGDQEDIPVYRWVFAKDSSIEGIVISGSMIHKFEEKELISFGYTSIRDEIIVTTDKTKPSSLNPSTASKNFILEDRSLKLRPDIDVTSTTDDNQAYKESNIIYLGDYRHQLDSLQIIENFPRHLGVAINSSPSINNTPISDKENGIQPYANGQPRTYLVRSSDNMAATVVYDKVTYTSSLADREFNVFRGNNDVKSFTASENALVYEIIDEPQHQTILMRIVNEIPSQEITSGNLSEGYWYLVHSKEKGNTSDYVTYKGEKYYAESSFCADTNLTFSTSSDSMYLRRCWYKDFDTDTETVDKSFWSNKQKPIWTEVVHSDLYCLMKYNSEQEDEMEYDPVRKAYITSAHPDYYHSVLGNNGILRPYFPIKGRYMQIKIILNTLNPM